MPVTGKAELKIEQAEASDLLRIKELSDQNKGRVEQSYDSGSSKLVVKKDGKIVAAIQYKTVFLVESLFIDQTLPPLARAYLFEDICETAMQKFAGVPAIWVSKRHDNRFVNYVYGELRDNFGVKSVNHRKYVTWKTWE